MFCLININSILYVGLYMKFMTFYPWLDFEVRLIHHLAMIVSCKDAWRESLLQIERYRPVFLQPGCSVPVWNRHNRSEISLTHYQRHYLLHPCRTCQKLNNKSQVDWLPLFSTRSQQSWLVVWKHASSWFYYYIYCFSIQHHILFSSKMCSAW